MGSRTRRSSALVQARNERMVVSVAARFASRYTVDEVTGCWLWTGQRVGPGYGRIKSRGVGLRAHVVSYEIHHGPVPKERVVCHRCGNPPCVNPAHLYAGTPQDNARDVARHGSVPGQRLAIEDVRAVKRRLAAGESDESIARWYRVAKPLISKIRRGVRWGWVETVVDNGASRGE